MRIGSVRPRWTAATIARVDGAGRVAAVADAGADAGALPDGVGHRRAVVVGGAELEQAEQDEEEDRQDQGELDERLARARGRIAAGRAGRPRREALTAWAPCAASRRPTALQLRPEPIGVIAL